MAYLTRDDLTVSIRATKLAQITEGDESDTLIDLAAGAAVALVRDALVARFDLDASFERAGTDRHPQVVRWCTTLALYFLWERIPDRTIPDRVKDAYDVTLAALAEISDGKSSVELPLRVDPDSGVPITKFRWGGDTPRQW